ncbi:MAG: hypothetical protein QF815_02100 [Candidatus Peribacteraceae bacterium]|jgi:hypothetical protein|nr:hypothetical protein [Candidatus Peribacteraceae bacterium]
MTIENNDEIDANSLRLTPQIQALEIMDRLLKGASERVRLERTECAIFSLLTEISSTVTNYESTGISVKMAETN